MVIHSVKKNTVHDRYNANHKHVDGPRVKTRRSSEVEREKRMKPHTDWRVLAGDRGKTAC